MLIEKINQLYIYNNRITYERTCALNYTPADMLVWLHKNYSREIEVKYIYNSIFLTFVIPGATVAGVSLWLQKFSVPNLFGYAYSLLPPFSVADLQLLKSIINFFEAQYSDYPNQFNNSNDIENRISNEKIITLLSGTDIITIWEQMNISFAEDNIKNKYEYFRASNGIHTFYLTPHFFSLPFDKASLTQQIIPAALQYIWQQPLVDLNNSDYYINVKKGGSIIEQFAFKATIWDNKNAQAISIYNYLVFQVNDKWLGVKLKVWLPVLRSYLKQYDATNKTKILPVLPDTFFNECKTQFANQATKLLFDSTETNGEIIWAATVIE